MSDKVGYSWLLELYGAKTVQPLRIQSRIGGTKQRELTDGLIINTYPATYQPDPTVGGHLTFALKYEGVNLEALARIFEKLPEGAVASWIHQEPLGQYARRAGFLWEWLTGRTLGAIESLTRGNYVDAVDADLQVAATVATNNTRWRVRDNLPGTPAFCPLIFHSDSLRTAVAFDCAKAMEALNVEFGADILLRSAVWLTIKESRSSFIIEREGKHVDRIERFAEAMERYCGAPGQPLNEATLIELQQAIVGTNTTLNHFGIRQSPVFIGSVSNYTPVVHYVAPHWDALRPMLQGLEAFLDRTQGVAPLLRAAACAFGFVYIHPLADGNGRTHRFLINDILRRDGAVPAPYILPISATITHNPVERARYDQILDDFSAPFMRRYRRDCRFGGKQTHTDGIESDFEFGAYEDAAPAWRYPDLTAHVEYVAAIVQKTILQEMTNEARQLRQWDQARLALKSVIDGPNTDIDRIIRSIRHNRGAISNMLRKEFPVLVDRDLAQSATEAVMGVFGAPAADTNTNSASP